MKIRFQFNIKGCNKNQLTDFKSVFFFLPKIMQFKIMWGMALASVDTANPAGDAQQAGDSTLASGSVRHDGAFAI